MTLNALKKIVDKLAAEGHGRQRVYIRKDTFRHPCEGDGCVVLDVNTAFLHTFPLYGGDGEMTEQYLQGLVLFGDGYDPKVEEI